MMRVRRPLEENGSKATWVTALEAAQERLLMCGQPVSGGLGRHRLAE